MTFLYPLGLLGLIGVPLLILIYILRSKYNEQTVPSTYLWTLSEKFFKRRNPLSGLTGIISLILQILTVIFVSLALARPIFIVPESASEYCFVLDATGSMNTKSGLKTDFDRAKDYIEDAINDARLGSSFTLIVHSSDGNVVYERLTDKKMAKEMLSEVECTDGSAEYSDTISKAQSYFNDNSSTLVYFVTDKDFERAENVEIVNISSQNVVNYALGEVSGNLTDGMLYASGKLTSYTTDATLKLEMYVNGSKDAAVTESYEVKAGETLDFELSAKVTSYDSFRVVITNKDDLAIDNEVICYNKGSEASYSILLVSETPFFLEASFDAITDSRVDVITPDEYKGQRDYGLYVFQSYTPDTLPDAAVWLINSNKSVENSGFGVRGINELSAPGELVMSTSTSSKARALLSGIVGRDIYIGEYVKYSGMYTQFTTLFSYDSNPLIFAGVNGLGNREVVFGFDLHKSDFPLSSDFTALVANLLEYSCPDILTHTDYVCGEDAEINITANIDSVKTISPDGEENYLDTSTDIASFTLDRVGTYTVKVNTVEGEKIYKLYSAAPESESDPNAIGIDFSVGGEQTYEKTDGEYDPVSIFFVLLALVFCADWMVYCYEKYQLR
jgi:hypothetical protein